MGITLWRERTVALNLKKLLRQEVDKISSASLRLSLRFERGKKHNVAVVSVGGEDVYRFPLSRSRNKGDGPLRQAVVCQFRRGVLAALRLDQTS
jgi:hypothetical protein